MEPWARRNGCGINLLILEYRELVKDLSCLSKDLSRVVIVDNNPFSFLLQPLNGIPCVPFSAGLPYNC
ncbi:FCP1-like domain [Populus alba x Populus x berolinensis]|nr:FCP1-like domain [Populus alba x Populus x berolinensis]